MVGGREVQEGGDKCINIHIAASPGGASCKNLFANAGYLR